MGWINRKPQPDNFNFNAIKAEILHVEDVEVHRNGSPRRSKPEAQSRKYPFVSTETQDNNLPFISKDEVSTKRRPGMVAEGDIANNPDRQDWWIVIDNIVYDCTDFILEHPGGEQVIMSFIGEDCSWQFWRFHGKSLMEQYGIPLRIGRTEGVPNRFKEPKRFVGLAKLGRDEW